MADSRILPTKEELAVQPGSMYTSSFFRVKGDDKFYWIRFQKPDTASVKNIAYYNALGMKALTSPITTCFNDEATRTYLKIDIQFLHELFGQELKDSYTGQEIKDKYVFKKQENLRSSPISQQPSSNLKSMETLTYISQRY